MIAPALENTRQIYDGVATPYLWIAVGVFAIVTLVLAWCLVRYRARPGRAPSQVAEASRVEIGYGVLLALITAGLLVITFTSMDRGDALGSPVASRHPLRVNVVGAQWEWRFSYPGTPVTQEPPGNGDPTVLYVPVGRQILFHGSSQDVLHDFWIPDLRFQRQVWPGHVERWGLIFPHPGLYQGLCAWFCGLYHGSMHFEVRALRPAQFDRWLRRRS